MKPIYRYIYLVAFLSMIWNVQAQMPTSAVVIDNTEQTIDYVDGLSQTVFNIEAPSIGNYYIRFWLNPTTSDNLTFDRHKVVINEEEIGYLTPICGGWQSIGISEEETVMLYEGENEIRIVGDAISAPMIDMVRISENAEMSEIIPTSSTMQTDQMGTIQIGEHSIQSTTIGSITDGHTALTTYYSFNKQMTLRAGQIITITTTGSASHGVDLFLYRNTDEVNTNVATNDLNWYGVSDAYSSTSTNHRATINTKIPVLGRYIVKLRSGVSGVQQTISNLTITVKDSISDASPTIYTYNNCKASYTRFATTIPANVAEYRVSAIHQKQQLGTSVSMDVCVEGDASEPGRVVRYARPATTNGSYYTGVIDAVYQIPASGIHVLVANSLTTSATCYIAVGETPSATMEMQAKSQESKDISDIISNNLRIGIEENRIVVQKTEANQQIEIYNLSGTLIYSGTDSVIPIKEQGIYIVRIGEESHKVVLY